MSQEGTPGIHVQSISTGTTRSLQNSETDCIFPSPLCHQADLKETVSSPLPQPFLIKIKDTVETCVSGTHNNNKNSRTSLLTSKNSKLSPTQTHTFRSIAKTHTHKMPAQPPPTQQNPNLHPNPPPKYHFCNPANKLPLNTNKPPPPIRTAEEEEELGGTKLT